MTLEDRNGGLLLFSGGRDSTLAAVRMATSSKRLVLVTITSDHLYGLESVEKRLAELARILPIETEWLNVAQPTNLLTNTDFYAPTCLPCHHAYVAVGASLARAEEIETIGFGYVQYQNSWPEQTPEATIRLKDVLAEMDLQLTLPVYGLASRADATTELEKHGLSTLSLEQKCSRQVNNIALAPDVLERELEKWEAAIRATLKAIDRLSIVIKHRARLSDFL